jgi:hypothetical protein
LAIRPGDIVQIIDESHPWFSCLLIVTEVKEWEVQAGVPIPHSNDKQDVGMAMNRLEFSKIQKVGTATITEGLV